jgi:hypothetical protein
MLSASVRLRLQDIANRIAEHEEVSFEEMTYAQKWANHHQSAAEILRKARRRANCPKPPKGSLDEFLIDMDLGDPDPSNHLIGPQDPEDLVNWFRRDFTEDWRQRD